MSESSTLTIHIDGAARGNPGPAAFAYVIARDGQPPIEEKGCLGTSTNNKAEYTALVKALERAGQLGAKRLLIHSDSELLVKQMNGAYRVKNEELRQLYEQAKRLSAQFDLVTIRHVLRAQNAEADRLCNEALDQPGGGKAAPRREGRHAAKAIAPPREAAIREEAVTCLRAVAAQWSHAGATDPKPEDVWEQLWSIIEDHGALGRRP